MTLHVKDSGVWREIKGVYVKDSGVWRESQEVYIKEAGVWQSVFKNLPAYTGVNSSNIGTICSELVSDFSHVILSAGPLFGASKSNTAGAFEIIVAPSIRLEGDTDTNWNQTKRYVLEVTASGFSYSTDSKYNGSNQRGGLSTATANNNLNFEQDATSFTTGTVLEFNHTARWGNSNNSSPSSTFTYALPRNSASYSLVGAGGGGGSNNNNGDAGAGNGGDSGGFYTGVSASQSTGTVVTMVVGRGGVGASYQFNGNVSQHPNANATDNASNSLYNNFYSIGRGEAGDSSSIQFGSGSTVTATGGGGGIAAFNNNVVQSPYATGENTGPGSPNGVAGSTPPWDSDAPQAGGNTGFADNIGDGGTGKLGVAVSGFDGAAWITLA
jgi:hypothetical protein